MLELELLIITKILQFRHNQQTFTEFTPLLQRRSNHWLRTEGKLEAHRRWITRKPSRLPLLLLRSIRVLAVTFMLPWTASVSRWGEILLQETLVDLLGVAGRRPLLPVVLCCNSRDELDAVYSAVSNLDFISSFPLYSDQGEAERASVLEKFHQSTIDWNQNADVHPDDCNEPEAKNQKSCMIVVTDACLPFVALGEAPLAARVLINYELPTKKEAYLRRLSTCLAADGIVINMVVGGEVVVLKGLEESSGLLIVEMPINISEIL